MPPEILEAYRRGQFWKIQIVALIADIRQVYGKNWEPPKVYFRLALGMPFTVEQLEAAYQELENSQPGIKKSSCKTV